MKTSRAYLSFVAQLLVVGVFVGFFGSLLATYEYFFSPPGIHINGGTLGLVGTRGEQTTFEIWGESINGRWASSKGLDFVGEYPIHGLIPPREKDWGGSMSVPVSGSKRRFEIRASIYIPSSL